MARFTNEYVGRARELIALYPQSRSALLPLLHLAQEQEGWVSPEAMAHIAEMLDLTNAEVLGTCSFYSMFKREPVGKHLVSVCTNIACLLNGGYELLEHAEAQLGVKAGTTTPDGEFTLEEVECIAACGSAPCLQVNYRFFEDVTNESFDKLVEDLSSGRLSSEVPRHGVLNRVRRTVKADRSVRTVSPSPNEGATSAYRGPAVSEEGDNAENQPANEGSVATATKDAQVLGITPTKRRRAKKKGDE